MAIWQVVKFRLAAFNAKGPYRDSSEEYPADYADEGEGGYGPAGTSVSSRAPSDTLVPPAPIAHADLLLGSVPVPPSV